MRSAIALSIISAAAVASAANCNPSYNVAGSGDCFTACNVKAGQTYVSGWTMDSTSEKFLPSLKVMCTKGTSQYTAFMTTAGMCMATCSDPVELFNAEFAGACAWYAEHKDDVCAGDAVTTTTAAAVTTTTAAAVTTTTAPAADATTAPAADATTAAATSSGAPAIVATALSSGVSAASSGASAASSAIASASHSGKPAAASSPAAAAPESAASKLQLGGYAMALVACASYFAL
ncbi:uncharacterized protein EV154DRAFT_513815 [Mucor mucedo]|uniref:uncharacterized protein n=1 Tax=Mucor mucedo TaxID=29922 RepID=UPI00221F75D8|nr:uncharacterized protein EV154DRAFT_513815 [Mucor mucedo]KAI7889702.1 hypothetical protein EV154DRAFT_513815 [Mucor mucedo]